MHPKMLFAIVLSIPAWFISCFNANKVTSQDTSPMVSQQIATTSFHTLKAVTIDGETISMDQYKGKK